MRRLRKRILHMAAIGDLRVGGLLRPNMRVEVGIARQRRRLLPRHLERGRGADRVPLMTAAKMGFATRVPNTLAACGHQWA